MKKKKKKKIGRPSKYRPAMCKSLVDWFSIEPYIIKDMTITKPDGTQIDKTEEVASDLPWFSDWCWKMDIDQETMTNWTKKYPAFFVAYKRAKELQEQILMTNALRGLYYNAFAIFTAKNKFGWKDNQNVEHTGKDGGAIQINFTKEYENI